MQPTTQEPVDNQSAQMRSPATYTAGLTIYTNRIKGELFFSDRSICFNDETGKSIFKINPEEVKHIWMAPSELVIMPYNQRRIALDMSQGMSTTEGRVFMGDSEKSFPRDEWIAAFKQNGYNIGDGNTEKGIKLGLVWSAILLVGLFFLAMIIGLFL